MEPWGLAAKATSLALGDAVQSRPSPHAVANRAPRTARVTGAPVVLADWWRRAEPVGVAADNHCSGGGDGRNWDRSDNHRSDRDHDDRRDRGDGHRRDQGTSSSWGDRGGDRDGEGLCNRDRQGSGR